MQLYAQSDQESRLGAQGKFLALLPTDKAHLLTETIQVTYLGLNPDWRECASRCSCLADAP